MGFEGFSNQVKNENKKEEYFCPNCGEKNDNLVCWRCGAKIIPKDCEEVTDDISVSFTDSNVAEENTQENINADVNESKKEIKEDICDSACTNIKIKPLKWVKYILIDIGAFIPVFGVVVFSLILLLTIKDKHFSQFTKDYIKAKLVFSLIITLLFSFVFFYFNLIDVAKKFGEFIKDYDDYELFKSFKSIFGSKGFSIDF